MKEAPVVLVRWVDATSCDETDAPEREATLDEVVSVGFLVTSDRTRVALAAMIFEDGCCRNVLSIPRGCVKSMKRL